MLRILLEIIKLWMIHHKLTNKWSTFLRHLSMKNQIAKNVSELKKVKCDSILCNVVKFCILIDINTKLRLVYL